MKKNAKKNTYVEPNDYFPKDIRKKAGLGEYAEKKTTATKKKVKRK